MAISFCSEEGGPFEMHTIDISAGGAQLYGSCGMQVGVMYDVSMVLPGDFGRVDGRGVAVWVKQDKRGRRYMAGLQFVGMSDAARKKIERFVQSVLQAEDGEMKHPRMKKTA